MILFVHHSSSDLYLPFLLQDGYVVVNKDGCLVVNKDTPGGTESEDIRVWCGRDRATLGDDGSGRKEAALYSRW